MGLTTYLYRGFNPVTQYYGHPSVLKKYTPENERMSTLNSDCFNNEITSSKR